MSTEATWQINSSSVEDTLALAARIGAELKGGEIIELLSDVGGGKTTFVRGLANGAGSRDHVSSPSFTISNVYKAEVLNVVHFDFYRLQEAGLIAAELQDILQDKANVVVVEWAGLIDDALPDNRLKIRISPTNEFGRRFDISYPGEYSEVMDRVKSETAGRKL